MTPIEAAATAAELADHMTMLIALDLNPVENADAIEQHRRMALECQETLSGYLHMSDTFGPVTA